MNSTEKTNLKTIIEKALKSGISYSQYRTLVQDLVENNSTTGPDKSEALANYTMLNDRRMKRWDKTVKVDEETVGELSKIKNKTTWIVLTESWCGDAAHLMPVMNKLAELNENIDFKVLLRDENEELMDQFLTNGGRSIPKLVMIDSESKAVINTFGPRPQEATKLVNDYKEKHGQLTPEFKEELQQWYNKDKGKSTIKDISRLSAPAE